MYIMVKTSHGSLSFKALLVKLQKLLEEFLLLTPGTILKWLHKVPPRGPVSRAGAETLTSVAPAPEAFAGCGPRLVAAMALEPKNAKCWRPAIQL